MKNSVAQVTAFLFPALVLTSLLFRDAAHIRARSRLHRRPALDRARALADHGRRRGPPGSRSGADRPLRDPGGLDLLRVASADAPVAVCGGRVLVWFHTSVGEWVHAGRLRLGVDFTVSTRGWVVRAARRGSGERSRSRALFRHAAPVRVRLPDQRQGVGFGPTGEPFGPPAVLSSARSKLSIARRPWGRVARHPAPGHSPLSASRAGQPPQSS